MKSMLIVVPMVLIAFGTVGAGQDHMAAAKQMMMDCHVCSNMAPHFDELMPVMKTEYISLDNGAAWLHTITDESKLDMFHASCDAVRKAGAETASFSDDEASAELCPICLGIRGLMQAGATMSYGKTDTGDIMVFSSQDPEVQKKIAAYQAEISKMMGMDKS